MRNIIGATSKFLPISVNARKFSLRREDNIKNFLRGAWSKLLRIVRPGIFTEARLPVRLIELAIVELAGVIIIFCREC